MKKGDDFIEQQYILRLPPELAERVDSKIIGVSSKEKNGKLDSSLSVELDSERHGTLYFSYYSPEKQSIIHEQYECLVVDMPTVIESYTSLNLDVYYKCGQIVKMILVTTEEFETKQRTRMKHLLKNMEPIITEEPIQSEETETPVLPPHMQQKHLNAQKREKELQEERELQQKRAEEERRRKEHELITKESELDPNIYHSGLTPSLVNIYEHWEKTKVTVTPKEVERMINNYYEWLFDEKDFKIEKITDDGNAIDNMQDAEDDITEHSDDEELKNLGQEMSAEEDQGEYSESYDEYSMSDRSDMDDSSSDANNEVLGLISDTKRERSHLIQKINTERMESKRLQREYEETRHESLRAETRMKIQNSRDQLQRYENELQAIDSKLASLQQQLQDM